MAENGRTDGQITLIVALARGAGVREAAQQTGVSERTVYRRLRSPDFQRKLQSARGSMLADAVGRLSCAATQAAETLTDLLSSPSESIRLGAARTILEVAPRLKEIVEFESRLTELERHAAVRSDEDAQSGCPRLLGPR